MEKRIVKSFDGYELDVHVFDVDEPKAVVQIIHGMEEHQERYEDFITFLNRYDFNVVSADLRGHGQSAKELGFFAEKNGHQALIEDQLAITHFIKEEFPTIPVYIFAHSMGTIIARVLLENHSKEYKKAALSGYPNYRLSVHLGLMLANVIQFLRGPKHKSKLLKRLTTGKFNKSIKNSETPYDWLSYNQQNVRSYMDDEYCGFGFTCSAYKDLFKLMILMHNPKNYKDINKSLKIFLVRGDDDPCTGGNDGEKDSKGVLSKAGFKPISTITYPEMRHEILNERKKMFVYKHLLSFFDFEGKNEKKYN